MGVNKKMLALGSKRSVIREIFEYSKVRAGEIGEEKVFDFSLGNPSVPAPTAVNETVRRLLDTESSVSLHGYTSAQGDALVRRRIAESINRRHGTNVGADNIYMTCGAAASLSICLRAVIEDGAGEECVVFAPFFTEYRVFVENAGASLVVSKPVERTFQIDISDLEKCITNKTKAVILNSPNNPSGVVYTEETVRAVCKLLERRSEEYGRPIYLIADEPYRELVYEGVFVPYLMNYYKNTLVCYSYSKSLSLPGERIGYIAVCPDAEGERELYLAVCCAGRSLGYVCAPALMQRVVAECGELTADVSIYKENRDLLYSALTSYGFECVKPDGAFYLFVKAPSGNAYELYEEAKKEELLVVPCDDFGVLGYVRIAYCVSKEKVLSALPAFKCLANNIGL